MQAISVEARVHNTLALSEPPWRRSSNGKRRWPTSATIAGVISVATNSSDTMTIKGMAMNSSSAGASTMRKLPRPRPSSHWLMLPTNW